MSNDETPYIPFMGDDDVSPDTNPSQLSPWIDDYDKVPILLALSLYSSPVSEIYPFKLIPGSNRIRAAAWEDKENGVVVIGCRGTSVGSRFGSKLICCFNKRDLMDDMLIAKGPYCDLTLVKLGSQLVRSEATNLEQADEYAIDKNEVIFVGHSLGGTASMCLTQKYNESRGISLNGGAVRSETTNLKKAPTNPILTGPGPDRFNHYHIVGDLISTHMSPAAANVTRIKIMDRGFGDISTHSSGNVLNKPFKIYSADDEDEEYKKWAYDGKSGWNIVKRTLMVHKYQVHLQIQKIVEKSPIPGSQRFYKKQ